MKIGYKENHSPNTIFDFICDGNFTLHSTRLLLRNGLVNKPIKEVCSKQLVRVAFNNDESVVEVDPETDWFIEYHLNLYVLWDYEIMVTFFEAYNLEATFLDCNYTWGWYEEGLGWTGAIGKVGKI